MPAPSVHLKIKIPVTVRRGISERSHEKIGDCEQSIFILHVNNNSFTGPLIIGTFAKPVPGTFGSQF